MARSDHLLIFKQAYYVLLCFEQMHSSLPKKYKYTLGQDLRAVLFQIVSTIVQINNLPVGERITKFKEFEIHLNNAELYLKVFCDVGGFLKKTDYDKIFLGLIEIRKQMYGWKKFAGA